MHYKNSEIIVSVAVCHRGTHNIIEECATMKEARKFSKENGYNEDDYWYLAAEVINKDGDTNPAVWNKERGETIKRLKKLL